MGEQAITAYPLSWPMGKPRTTNRRYGRFQRSEQRQYTSGGSYRATLDMTMGEACKRLQSELDRIGARDVVLSSNVPTRLDGLPRADQRDPKDPGVACYFKLKGKPHCLPCDTYTKVEQNICALAAHIEATRAIERYGVADLAAMFTGFQALPSPEHASAPMWHQVLGIATPATLAQAELAYRRRRSETHPDKPGGSQDAFDLVQRAWEQAQQELRA